MALRIFFLHRNWTQYVNRGKDSGGFNSMEVNVSCKVWERHIGFHEANQAKQVGSKIGPGARTTLKLEEACMRWKNRSKLMRMSQRQVTCASIK